jgi:phytoene synthase
MAEAAGDEPTALAALLSAYAGEDMTRHRLLWALDERLARLAATTTEPMIGQIRLAWWHEALSDDSGVKGRGEPLIDAMREAHAVPPAGFSAWLDGWEAMIGDVDLDAFAEGRGGGLFHSLAGADEAPDWLVQAGSAWALWDLSGRAVDPVLAVTAIGRAKAKLLAEPRSWPASWRPMRIAYGLARQDILKGRPAPKGLTPGLYLRLLRVALTAR